MGSAASAEGLGTVLVANPSADLYGSDRMMLEAVRGLTASGADVLVTCSEAGPLLDQLADAGARVAVLSIPVVRKSMMSVRGLVGLAVTSVRALPRMCRLIRSERPSVIVVNTLTIPLWLVAAVITRVPSVVYVHEAEGSVAGWARRALSAPLVLARRVVFNSQTSLRVSGLRVLERTDRARVVHNGVRGPQASTPPRPSLDEPIRILYIGRLSARKGVDLVLEAAHRLNRAGRSVTVDVVGSVFPGNEWYERDLRRLSTTLKLEERVKFHGFSSSVWDHLRACDIAVVPSRLDESFGNALIEALLAERPVVASDHTGLSEAAAGFGAVVLVPSDDAGALADAVAQIGDDWAGFRERTTRDAVRAASLYGPARFHARLIGVLGEVARPRR